MQKCSKRTVRQMEELAIFVNFVIFERFNNYFRPGPRLLYAACSFKGYPSRSPCTSGKEFYTTSRKVVNIVINSEREVNADLLCGSS